MEYEQSREIYKEHTLIVWRYKTHSASTIYHRECRVFKDGELIGYCKSKKQAKQFIDDGIFYLLKR